MKDAHAGENWVVVHLQDGDPVVRRYRVPGGWLCQTSQRDCMYPGQNVEQWHPPVFVPYEPADMPPPP